MRLQIQTDEPKINESTDTWDNDIWDSYEKQINERQLNLRQISVSIEEKVTTSDSCIRSTITTWFRKNKKTGKIWIYWWKMKHTPFNILFNTKRDLFEKIKTFLDSTVASVDLFIDSNKRRREDTTKRIRRDRQMIIIWDYSYLLRLFFEEDQI